LSFEKIIILKFVKHELSQFTRFFFVHTHESDCGNVALDYIFFGLDVFYYFKVEFAWIIPELTGFLVIDPWTLYTLPETFNLLVKLSTECLSLIRS
jgi:hypothetical protein